MKRTGFILVLLILYFGTYSQTKSYKRGVAYGYHSVKDMQNFSPHISWWNNWAAQPDVAIRSTYQNYKVDFTPMAWNNIATCSVSNWADKDSTIKYILGFNEPNFKDQANTPNTGGWQTWRTVSKEIELEEGDHILKMLVRAANFNINWIEISNSTSVKNEIEIFETEVYPNPATNGIINVVLHRAQSGGDFTCRLYDIYGKQVFSKNVQVNRALFQINLNESGRLPSGVYYLNISGENSMANKLIVVQ